MEGFAENDYTNDKKSSFCFYIDFLNWLHGGLYWNLSWNNAETEFKLYLLLLIYSVNILLHSTISVLCIQIP